MYRKSIDGICHNQCGSIYPGVTGDASGTGRGGMFIFDLSGSGNAGKVVYERTVTGLCQGKEISFSAMFGAINNNTSPNVGTLNLVLRSGSSSGAVIYETGKTTLNGTEGWQEASKSFTLAAGISTVVLQVVNVDDSYGNSQGDLPLTIFRLLCALRQTCRWMPH